MLRSKQSKCVVSISLLGLLYLAAPELARARVYSYVGNPYTACEGTYADASGACAGSYRLSITFTTDLSAKALDNLPEVLPGHPTDITASVTNFTFTDGDGVTLTSANAPDYSFELATNAKGLPNLWILSASDPLGPYAVSCINHGPCWGDVSSTGGYNQGFASGPGQWSFGSLGSKKAAAVLDPAVPEPSTWAMMLLGFAGLGYAGYRRARAGHAEFVA